MKNANDPIFGAGSTRESSPLSATPTAEKKETLTPKIDSDLRIFIGGIYGESSQLNLFEEMAAIGAVLLRQRTARGHSTWKDFIAKERSYAFAFTDGNPRFKAVSNATDDDFLIGPLNIALNAANHALAGGTDYSNGGYFWDGDDLVLQARNKRQKGAYGFHFSDPEHDIFSIGDVIKHWEKRKTMGTGKSKKTEIVASCEWAYESTAAYDGSYPSGKKKIHTGTVFWKLNDTFTKHFGSGKAYL